MDRRVTSEVPMLHHAAGILLMLTITLTSLPAMAQDKTPFGTPFSVDLVETTGDRLQVLLPVAGAICAFGRREFAEYLLRFVALEGLIHGPKNLLGDSAINIRPNGGDRGFPSGHTTAAFFGASALARTCLKASPPGQAVVFGLAMITGGSRIEAGKHFLFQVIAGAILGLLVDRLFRRRRQAESRWPGWLARLKAIGSR